MPPTARSGLPTKACSRAIFLEIPGQEVIVWDTDYGAGCHQSASLPSGGDNILCRLGHGHLAEDNGKAPVTLKAGDSLFVPAGTNFTPTGIRAIPKVCDFWSSSPARKIKCAPSRNRIQTERAGLPSSSAAVAGADEATPPC